MPLTPLTTRSARTAAGKVRLYAAPQFVRPDGRTWRPIREAVCLRQLDGMFRVDCGGEWAELAPAKILPGLRETIAEGGHFGWRLDARQTADELTWLVRHSKGAERIEGGIVLGRPDGVPLGLFWTDWKRHKPRLVGDQLTIDVSAAKAKAVSDYGALGSPKESYPLLFISPV